jgi:predicted lactoylglutathione lyase
MNNSEFWLNVPVNDIYLSCEFFKQLGFKINENYPPTDSSACVILGKHNMALMLFTHEMFNQLTGQNPERMHNNGDFLISFDAESKDAVDAMALKVQNAGGTLLGKPNAIDSWMYGFAFRDINQHLWNVLYMDKNKRDNKQ